jgi:DNA repair protein RadC
MVQRARETAAAWLADPERPRERLFRRGAEALSAGELLAVLFRSGGGRGSAAVLGEALLAHVGGIRNLGGVHWTTLCQVPGVGRARAAQVMAALELGRRLAAEYIEGRTEVRGPADVHRLLADMRFLDREHFQVLLLDTKNRLLAIETVAVGTLNASIVHPREVFKPAIRQSAAALILVHNHPTGNPSPSPEDVEMTRRIAETGRIVGIEILDHVIIGERGFESLREAGVL